MRPLIVGVSIVLACSGMAIGQDSVAAAAGGNDSLAAHDTATLRVRYAVDASLLTSSWGNSFRIAPLLKSTRDLDPMFRSQILGTSTISASFAAVPSNPAASYAIWSAAGAGVSPLSNSAPSSASPTTFSNQFAVAFVDLSLDPTNLTVATVGRDPLDGNRFYVERTQALSSRLAPVSPDTATLSLGAVTSTGRAFVRADAFTALETTSDRITGDNILLVNAPALAATSVNTLVNSGGVNTAAQPAQTTYIVRNDSAPYSTPSAADLGGSADRALIFDLRAFYRSGTSTGTLSGNTSGHRPTGIAGQRGNPSFSPITPLGGSLGTVASLAKPSAGGPTALVNSIAAFGVNMSGSTAPVAAGSPRSFALPSPISVTGFVANSAGTARFDQYKSQHVFRGGNGVVGIGRNADNQLVLAAVATDPSQGDFIAVVTATGPSNQTWTVAARPGQSVLDGPSGSAVGQLATTGLQLSAPAVDLVGNVYFAATWLPTLEPVRVGVFKAVNIGGDYRIELLVSEGDAFVGINSATPYSITSIALRDSDSLASGAFHSGSLLQAQTPGSTTNDSASPLASGGLVVNSTITYDRAGTPESYATVLLITPDISTTPPLPCPGDYNGSGTIDLLDLLAFNGDWSMNLGQAAVPGTNGDYDQSGTVDLLDLLAFNSDWSANLGTACP